jgi:hypothetical protein
MGKPELKVDERLEDGPIKDRGCTDVICCMLFIAFWGATLFFSFNYFKKGDLNKVMRPVDFNGNPCGMMLAKDYPYLFFGKLRTIDKDYLKYTVCVKKCPVAAAESLECFTNDAYPR